MKSNNRIYIILLVSLLVALSLIIFGVWPLLEEIEKNSEDLVLVKNDIITFDTQIKEIVNFKNNYINYQSNLEKIDDLFIDSSDPVDFIKFLEKAAAGSPVVLKISLPSFAQEDKGFLLLEISSSGEFSDILNFIKTIESGPYLIEMENLVIKSTDDLKGELKDSSQKKVDATFSIKAFTKNEN